MTTETAAQTKSKGLNRLADRVAIITGAAQGIGLATAELFSREGAKLVIIDVDEALAVTRAAELQAANGQPALGLKVDVKNFTECEAAVKTCMEKFGRIDILINNAGITRDNLLMRMPESDWDLVMDINLKGAFNFTKVAVRPMLKAHYGRIINIASVVGQEGNAGQANYAASKGGLIAFTKSCAREFGSRNILVNAISPGFIKTRLTDAIPEAAKQYLLNKILVGRMGEPLDIARGALFLASEDSSYVTGQVLGINGGGYIA